MRKSFRKYLPKFTLQYVLVCMMISNCSGKGSFTVLKKVKNHNRSNQSNERMSVLVLLCIEAELNKTFDYDSLTNEFSLQKTRKLVL